MHLTPKYINIVINILLGAAWAVTFYGFFNGFSSVDANIFIKFLSGLVHMFIGIVAVLVIEVIYLQFKRYEEQKRTNRLLREILKKNS